MPHSPTDTIPPTTRKRKAAEATLSSVNKGQHPKKRVASAASPPTPVTAGSPSMDSDDDFMSGVSSEDDVLQDESDNDNASGDGMWL